MNPAARKVLLRRRPTASVALSGFVGAQVKKSADQTGADYTTATAISWGTSIFDTNSFSNGGSKLIVPALANGYYGVVLANVSLANLGASTNSVALSINKGGTGNYIGSSGFRRGRASGVENTATKHWIQCRTPPIQLATGDEFESILQLYGDSSVDLIGAQSSFAIYLIGSSPVGCLLYDASGTTGQNYNFAMVNTWDTALYDSDGFFSGANPSRITIPSSVNGRYGIFKSNIRLASVAATQNMAMQIVKNSTGVPGFDGIGTQVTRQSSGDSSGLHWCEVESQPILLSTGDFYEVNLHSQDTSTDMSQYSTFGLEVMPASFKGCLAKMNADQAAANYNGVGNPAFDGTDIYDTDGGHDPASSNTKIIVPSAWNGKKAILLGNAYTSNLTSNSSHSLGIQRGGSNSYDGYGSMGGDAGSFTNDWLQARSQIVELATAQEYTASLWINDTSVTLEQEGTSFGLRLLPEL